LDGSRHQRQAKDQAGDSGTLSHWRLRSHIGDCEACDYNRVRPLSFNATAIQCDGWLLLGVEAWTNCVWRWNRA
jgi:hypothetical protein